ncbi:hypothetical protein ACQP0C_35495 [Nocardia sp. CA-129566]|uniref:hypothetical protein n=1 Tax=Nocardia sp. CA-129566 TaxID=3239976 RepID=UPI003D96DAFC
MTVSRPPDLRPGNRIRLGEAHYAVSGVSAATVWLVDEDGEESSVERAALFADPGFGMADSTRAPLPAQALLDGFSPEVADQARWWEQHLVEVLSGVPPRADPGVTPRPEYDITTSTLRQREIAKVAELEAAGNPVSLRKFQRMRRSYETEGLLGLVDGRTAGRRATRIDDRVVEAVRAAVAGEADRSTGTVSRLRRRVEKILADEHGFTPALPRNRRPDQHVLRTPLARPRQHQRRARPGPTLRRDQPPDRPALSTLQQPRPDDPLDPRTRPTTHQPTRHRLVKKQQSATTT